MKQELTTNIKWHLATEVKPGDDVHQVIAFMTLGYIATLNVCQGHFNCSCESHIAGDNEFTPGEDVLYWTYVPKALTIAAEKYEKQHSKN